MGTDLRAHDGRSASKLGVVTGYVTKGRSSVGRRSRVAVTGFSHSSHTEDIEAKRVRKVRGDSARGT